MRHLHALLALVLLVAGASRPWARPDDDKPNPPRRSLRKEYAEFLNKPAPLQEHLRRMDRELHDEDSATQLRLMRLMQRYGEWLESLSQEQRKRVLETNSTAERLEVIAAIREEQWISTLPKADEARLAMARMEGGAAYREAIADLRQQQQARTMEWMMAQAEFNAQGDNVRRQLNQLRNALMAKLDDGEKTKLESELKDQPPYKQFQILRANAEKKGVAIPRMLRDAQLPANSPPVVDMHKLLSFLSKPENEAFHKEFIQKTREPGERPRMLMEAFEKYWAAHPAELQQRLEHDKKARQRREKNN